MKAISEDLKERGVVVTLLRARKKAHKEHKGKARMCLEKEQPQVQRTPVKMIKNPLQANAGNAKEGGRESIIPGFRNGTFPNMG